MTIVLDGSSGITAPGGTAAAPSLTTSGDVNTGIFFPAADTIAFSEGGVEAMRIDSSGNVGIGTGSPSSKLDLVGVLQWQATAGTVLGKLTYSGGEPVVLANTGLGLNFYTNNAFAAKIDSSGNLGLGVTPSAFAGAGKIIQFGNGNASIGTQNSGDANFMHNAYENPNATFKYVASGVGALRYQLDINNNVHKWYYAASGTANNTISFTQAMTLDASGRLLVGTTSASGNAALQVKGATSGYARLEGTSSTLFAGDASQLISGADAANSAFRAEGALLFAAGGGTERARITSGGFSKFSNNGTYLNSTASYYEIRSNTDISVLVTQSTSTNAGVIVYNAQLPTSAAGLFFIGETGGVAKIRIEADGDVYNANGTYGTISDERLKQDIVNAPSQWDDIKAVRFRKYRMKTDVEANADAPVLLGVVAQELEQTSPGLVEERSNEDGTTTKTVKSSVLLMKAAVALQEAMTRIETLEAKVAALEGNN